MIRGRPDRRLTERGTHKKGQLERLCRTVADVAVGGRCFSIFVVVEGSRKVGNRRLSTGARPSTSNIEVNVPLKAKARCGNSSLQNKVLEANQPPFMRELPQHMRRRPRFMRIVRPYLCGIRPLIMRG